MKKTIILLLLCAASGIAQPPPPGMDELPEGSFRNETGFIYENGDQRNGIWYMEGDSTSVRVEGDTIQAIRNLISWIERDRKNNEKIWLIVFAAMDLYNHSGAVQNSPHGKQLADAFKNYGFINTPVPSSKKKKKK